MSLNPETSCITYNPTSNKNTVGFVKKPDLRLCSSETSLAVNPQLCGKGLRNRLAAMRCEVMCLMTVVPRVFHTLFSHCLNTPHCQLLINPSHFHAVYCLHVRLPSSSPLTTMFSIANYYMLSYLSYLLIFLAPVAFSQCSLGVKMY